MHQPPKVATAPPPTPPPTPPPAPLVFPQNVAKAAPSQPVPPDAIPVLSVGGLAIAPEPETPIAPLPVTVRPVSPPTTSRVETPSPPPSEVQPPAPGTTARAPTALQSRSDRTRNRAAIEAQIRETQATLGQLQRRNLTGEFKDDRDRATSLLELARQAIARSDLRQADDLSGRAAILAKTLLDAN